MQSSLEAEVLVSGRYRAGVIVNNLWPALSKPYGSLIWA
jgi:hypothetical protein